MPRPFMKHAAVKKLNPFNYDGNALADADAHGAKGIAPLYLFQLVEGCGDQTSATCAKRMTDCNGAAVGANVRRVIRQTELTQDGESLCSECFVEFDYVHLRKAEASQLKSFVSGRNRANAHHARRNPSRGCFYDSCARS